MHYLLNILRIRNLVARYLKNNDSSSNNGGSFNVKWWNLAPKEVLFEYVFIVYILLFRTYWVKIWAIFFKILENWHISPSNLC